MITPNSEIRILQCPLELDNENQITFSNSNTQYNYFNGLPHKTMTNCTFQRENSVIRYNGSFEDLIGYNYVMYKNTNYGNKWFYAYVTNMEYKSDNTTFIYIKEDVYQTWQFDITFMRSFVEREHVNDDSWGANRLDEGLECGELITAFMESSKTNVVGDRKIDYSPVYFMMASDFGVAEQIETSGFLIGGIPYQGVCYRSDEWEDIVSKIKQYNENGKIDSIYNFYVVPKWVADSASEPFTGAGWVDERMNTLPAVENVRIPYRTHLGGYTPTNKKLLCYPYNSLVVYNNAGSSMVLRYENFTKFTHDDGHGNSTGYIQFTMKGVATPGGSVYIEPYDYDASYPTNVLNRLSGAKYPSLSWTKDQYATWSALNSYNLGLGVSSDALKTGVGVGAIALGIATGNIAIAGVGMGMVGSGLGGAIKTMGQINDMKIVPDVIQGNTNIGDINFSNGDTDFRFVQRCITTEYARSIDNFFSMYGYKVNRLKVPNITGRANWNFVKCTTANVKGTNVPQTALNEIKQMLLNGCTFWHNTSNFLNYGVSNGIV